MYGKTSVGGSDLKNLQILLGIVVAISLTVLILLILLLVLKFKSNRKKVGSRSDLNDSMSMRQLSPTRDHQVCALTFTLIDVNVASFNKLIETSELPFISMQNTGIP